MIAPKRAAERVVARGRRIARLIQRNVNTFYRDEDSHRFHDRAGRLWAVAAETIERHEVVLAVLRGDEAWITSYLAGGKTFRRTVASYR